MNTIIRSSCILFLTTLPAGLAHAQTCNATFADEVRYAAGGRAYSVMLGDLDGDGDLDMVVANESSDDTSVLLNNGDGTFADQTRFAVGGKSVV